MILQRRKYVSRHSCSDPYKTSEQMLIFLGKASNINLDA